MAGRDLTPIVYRVHQKLALVIMSHYDEIIAVMSSYWAINVNVGLRGHRSDEQTDLTGALKRVSSVERPGLCNLCDVSLEFAHYHKHAYNSQQRCKSTVKLDKVWVSGQPRNKYLLMTDVKIRELGNCNLISEKQNEIVNTTLFIDCGRTKSRESSMSQNLYLSIEWSAMRNSLMNRNVIHIT